MSKGRLPSFRGPRDLSLGAKLTPAKSDGTRKDGALKPLSKSAWADDKKKKFTPNLNIQRKDAKATATDSSPKLTSQSGWKKTQNSGKSDNFTKTNKFAKPDLIQTNSGVFADGLGNSNDLKKKGWGASGAGSSGDSKAALERPKLDLSAKFDKTAEEKKLKELLRDDFIDDLKTGHMVPVQLPMVDTGKVFKEENIKKEIDPDEVVEKKKVKNNRILDSSDEEDEGDKKEVATEGDKKEVATTLSDLINEKHSELLFFQMPDHFPGHAGDKAQPEIDSESNVTLDTLTEGFLGELKLRKSGKVQLWINNVLFDVDIGTQVGFLQELYSVDGVQERQNSTDKGNMTNLGRVRNRVVVTPAWNDLLLAANAEETSSDSDDD